MSDRAYRHGDRPAKPGHSARARAVLAWRFVVLVEIANFAMLRRHIGPRLVETLAGDIVVGLLKIDSSIIARAVGRDLIQIVVSGATLQSLDAMLKKFTLVFESPLTIDSARHLVEINIGAAAAEIDACDDVRLIEEAEIALAESRAVRRPIAREVAQGAVVVDRMAIARDLSDGIADGQMVLHYQPKLNVRRQEISGVEALIRWNHPEHGLIGPNDFIPLAEQSRDIVPLTLWTIEQVIRDQHRLSSRGHDIPVFINIAGVLLSDTAFVQTACALIRDSGAKLGFEITETSVIRDPQCAIAHLNVFASIGIVIAIDDYGAGLSSLAYLKQLPAKELKIDKLFITHLTSSHRDPLIVRSTIDLAHALEMEVVAEGVETAAALALLSVMGCDVAQGYFISRPIAFEALCDFLTSYRDERPVLAPAPLFRDFQGTRAARR